VISRVSRAHVAINDWVRANPWKWSIAVGCLMFFVGWLVYGRGPIGLGIWAGVGWGVAFFLLNAAMYAPRLWPRFARPHRSRPQ